MKKTFKIVDGDISDGYHTFDELYEHRNLLFINLCRSSPDCAYWKPDGDNWFVLFFEHDRGQISYHLPNSLLYLVQPYFERMDHAKWDGHTSKDVLYRLESGRVTPAPIAGEE